ncbi:MAG: translation initiation factor IF-2 [Oligoflexales bacterium]|nr:translation initiation factor IF-2 [Oligoflexales bacterium]
MSKTRVYELARDLNVESKALLAELERLDIKVSSHQSTLTAAQIDKIRAHYLGSKPTVIIRRRRKEAVDELVSDSTAPEGSVSDLANESHPVAVEVTSALSSPNSFSGSHLEEPELSREVELSEPSETPEDPEQPATSRVPEGPIPAISAEAEVHESSRYSEGPVGQTPDLDIPVSAKMEERPETSVVESEVQHSSPEQLGASPATDLKSEDLDKVGHAVTREDTQAGHLKEAPLMSGKEAHASLISRIGASLKNSALSADPSRQPPKKAVFTSATIVRKALPEEAPQPRQTSRAPDPKQKVVRREDFASKSRPFTQRPADSASGPGGSSSSSFQGGQRPPFPPRQAFTPEEELLSKGGTRRAEVPRSVAPHQEDEKEGDEKKVHWHKKQQKLVSTRELLVAALREDPDEIDLIVDSTVVGKKRTVYSPGSAAQKKKDLKKRRDLKSTMITTPRAAYRVVKMDGSLSVAELARQLNVKASDVIKKLMAQGLMLSLHQKVDFDTASLIASEYQYECKNIQKTEEHVLGLRGEGVSDSSSVSRAPIVTVMGHVDHGKTSILDAIRQTGVASQESGGITQHIGAYTVETESGRVAFLDTPGHEAFSAMRARGAKLTDIIVLVVAADDGVMPQTVEAISHAKQAGVPIIVAINKIDKPNLNLDRLYNQLSEQGLQSEEWGGETQFVKVSALKKTGLTELLEAIHLQAEVLELRSPVDGKAEGVVVEAHLDKGKGPVATVMVTRGTLRVGDILVVGNVTGRVRAMMDYRGVELKEALPSTPAQIVGLTSIPMAGDMVHVVDDEKTAKELVEVRLHNGRKSSSLPTAAINLSELLGKAAASELPQVCFLIKADTQGSTEAIHSAISRLVSAQVRATVIQKTVGAITESDIYLAKASSAVVIGFNAKASKSIEDLADQEKVSIKYFSVIYDVLDVVKTLMAGKLPPITSEVVQGHAEVRNTIHVPKIGVIAGSAVTDGKITRACQLRVLRDSVVIHAGRIASLKRFKDDVKEVLNGYECGISIDGYSDVRIGDQLEAYMIEERVATLQLEGQP